MVQHEIESSVEKPAAPVPFLRRLPSRVATAVDVPIEIIDLDMAVALQWHSLIQTVIDTDSTRTDNGWRWQRIVTTANIAGRLQRPIGLAACVKTTDGVLIPCAMVQLVARFPALDSKREQCAFLWYLADAPEQALSKLVPPASVPKMLGTLAVDIAVTFSMNDGVDGRVGLHADENGGQNLMDFYLRRGMTNHPRHGRRPSLWRPNDGRYFYYTPESAHDAHRQLAAFRTEQD
jgi:hypothetical protein